MSKKPTRDEKRTKHDLKHFDAIERALRQVEPQFGMDEPIPAEFKDLENWT